MTHAAPVLSAPGVDPVVAGLRDRVRDAATRGVAMRIAGTATWLDAGRAVTATERISMRDHSGIVEYVPGDLTMTVRAGTTLAEMQAATAPHNQWVALDPHGGDEGTIGATVATASAGPLATFFGTPRDLVLGVEFVTGAGAVARGGGRVVKNVAGFDLTRLITGSWGTLGVITEVTVRLHARPEVDVSCVIPIEDGDVGRVRSLLRGVPFKPYACEVVNAALGRVLLGSAQHVALFRLAGNAEAVKAQRSALAELGAASEIDVAVWAKLRTIEPSRAIVFRLSNLPSEIERTWSEASRIEGALLHAAPARGIVRVVIPSEARNLPERFSRSLAALGMTIAGERMPAEMWHSSESELSSRVKKTFDPSNVLNPGILG